jgi:hypothetical protein
MPDSSPDAADGPCDGLIVDALAAVIEPLYPRIAATVIRGRPVECAVGEDAGDRRAPVPE